MPKNSLHHLLGRRSSLILISVASILMGALPFFFRSLSYDLLSPATISFWRLFSCWLFILLWRSFSPPKKNLPHSPSQKNWLFAYGIVGIGLMSLTNFSSLKHTSIATSIMLIFSITPLTTYFIEKQYRFFSLMHLFALLILLFGLGLLLFDRLHSNMDINSEMLGILLAVACGICFGAYTPIVKKISHLPTSITLFWGFLIASLTHLPFLHWNTFLIDLPTFFDIALTLGFLGTVIPFVLIQFVFQSKKITPLEGSMAFLLEPVSAILLGLTLGESLSLWNWLGVVLILCCISFSRQFFPNRS